MNYKIVNEIAPFHPSASHVEPAYRDGWNDCYKHLLAWREIAENMDRYAWHKTDCDMKRNGLDGDCPCGYFAALAAYEKAVNGTKAAICNMMKLAYAQEVLGPGAVLKSITAEPKGSRVLVLAHWYDKFYVVNIDGKITTLTFEDISKHWLVQANPAVDRRSEAAER